MIINKFGIRTLILALLLLMMAVVPVVGASIDEASSEVSIENISYTETELKKSL
ncbi:MAG: hypothetical protein ACPK85_09840 [Methanosarcina sp.]